MVSSPCAKCTEKGCGSRNDTCEKYLDWLREREQAQKKQRRDSENYTFQLERIRKFKGEK